MSAKIIKLEGSPYEIGLAHGRKFRKGIKDFTRSRILRLCEGGTITEDELMNIGLKLLPFNRLYDTDVFEELEGIAEGSGVNVHELIITNGLTDIMDLANRSSMPCCTSFAVNDDRMYALGQNWDMHSESEDHLVVFHIVPDEGPEILSLTLEGTVGLIGLNSKGLAVLVNNLAAKDACFGVVFPLAIRKALMQERIGDALNALISTERAGGRNYIIGDMNREIFDIELTGKEHEVIYVGDGVYAHANHYLTDRLKKWEAGRLSDSYVRSNRMGKLLGKMMKDDGPSLEGIMGCMRDHVNYPTSICRHVADHEEHGTLAELKTCAGVVILPSEGEMHILKGNPCEGTFEKIGFD